jgi:hypothetical protein
VIRPEPWRCGSLSNEGDSFIMPAQHNPALLPALEPWINGKASARATRAAQARKASNRRRFVDPTTCDRDYSADELEVMAAMQAYKQSSGRMFPTWSEVLEVLQGLGYQKP